MIDLSAAWARAEPMAGLAGGLLIGIAAVVMLIGLGRIAGISGLIAQALAPGGARPTVAGGLADRTVALLFLASLLFGGLAAVTIAGPGRMETPAFASWPLLVMAGMLVGFGTRLGSGCTSGHGVCGLSRLSARSLVATLTFIGVGMAVVALLRALAPQLLIGAGA